MSVIAGFAFNRAAQKWEVDKRSQQEFEADYLDQVYAIIEERHKEQLETGVDHELFYYVGWIGSGFAVEPHTHIVCGACKVAITENTCISCGRSGDARS